MANLQSYFTSFHDAIKLDYDDNKELRDKRDELLEILKENMPSDAGSFSIFHQGSYAMHTGIKSLDRGDYDIDVGLLFSISNVDYPNPVTVKKWVYDALKKKYENVEMKQPCVSVKFEGEGERNYHVDFAVYADSDDDNDTFLARGKLSSNAENRCWEESDPKTLVNDIKNHLSDSKDREQFRRTIRYLKRWKDYKFKGQVNRPTGIGLTVAALTHFQAKSTHDWFSNTKMYNDLEALENFAQNMLNAFVWVMSEKGEWEQRLRVYLPTPPYNDIYAKMTGNQMIDFKEKLDCLLEKIQKAKNETDPVAACKLLEEEFGDDFPVPEESATAQKRGPAILADHSSA
ncbi:nucleotidyltransferase [Cytobacillus firmus]|uniref:nucleotidyltransferase domain-containing protein n=1 Tax=Cytobacillus firmus TaxID=1399 RepID=UPI0021C682AB|nr:nucleotidyltransferase [Cytobacillus firmus]MCU1808239.1 nucleotidyltransferase [Cytobacillus firmus]